MSNLFFYSFILDNLFWGLFLLQTLIVGSQTPDTDEALCMQGDEDSAVFFLELLIKVVLQNRLDNPFVVMLFFLYFLFF